MSEIQTGKWGAKEFFARWMREGVATAAGLLTLLVSGKAITPSTFGSWEDLWLWITQLALVGAAGFVAGLASSLGKLLRVKKEDKDEGNTDVQGVNVAPQGQ